MDTEKSFDRFLGGPIFIVGEFVGVPPRILRVARLYRFLRRLLFANGLPTHWLILLDDGIEWCGLPQAHPLAPLFCNIAMAVWENCLLYAGCSGFFSYLDDRTFFADSLALLDKVMGTVCAADQFFCISLNTGKSARFDFG